MRAAQVEEADGEAGRSLPCDQCGRPTGEQDLSWEEGNGSLLCPFCRDERASCGCSDDQP